VYSRSKAPYPRLPIHIKNAQISGEKLDVFQAIIPHYSELGLTLGLVLGNAGGFAEGDGKEQGANDAGKNEDVSDSFHG